MSEEVKGTKTPEEIEEEALRAFLRTTREAMTDFMGKLEKAHNLYIATIFPEATAPEETKHED